jgi:hypothetical protein
MLVQWLGIILSAGTGLACMDHVKPRFLTPGPSLIHSSRFVKLAPLAARLTLAPIQANKTLFNSQNF